jgi:hypothetical protein
MRNAPPPDVLRDWPRARGAGLRSRYCLLWVGLSLVLAGCGTLAMRPAPPQLSLRCANPQAVGLEWKAVAGRSRIGYRVWRDGAVIGATGEPEYTDTTVSPSHSYTYRVSAAGFLGRSSWSTALAVATAAASPGGDPPYCRSRLIRSMRWHWSEGTTQANGSDLWPVAWGADGAVYAFFGDGGGFGGSDTLGRTSFGIARLSGPSPLGAVNVYGGYQALHPASLHGKASSIIAIGADFYALAGIYRPEDEAAGGRRGPSGSPDHVEIAYSRGNAYSWRTANWSFCGARFAARGAAIGGTDDRKEAGTSAAVLSGDFCPIFFVGFGRGNAGAPGGFAYLVGAKNSSSVWRDVPGAPPAQSYLSRVAPSRLLRRTAYEYFAGLDAHGAPRWSRDPRRMRPIFSDANPNAAGCGDECGMAGTLVACDYLPGLHRYLAVAQAIYMAQTSFYEAPELWGPWSVVSYDNIDPLTGRGGWANLGRGAGIALGVHPVNAWASADGLHLWVTYSSNGVAPPEAAFPPGGTAMDAFNLVGVDLEVAGPGER